MAHRRAFRIEAGEGAKRRNAGQLRQSHRHRGELVEREMLGHRHRLKARRGFEVGADLGHVVRRQRQQARQLRDHRVGILELVGNEIDPVITSIDGHRLPVTIDDPAAAGRDQTHLDAIALGKVAVPLVLGDRDIAHAPGQDRRETDLAGADQEGSPGESVRLAALGDGRNGAPSHRASRHRSSASTSLAATG